MAPRSGQCVKIVSPHSGSVTVLSRSASAASSCVSLHADAHNASRHGRSVLTPLDDNVLRRGNTINNNTSTTQPMKETGKRRPATAPVDLFLSRPAPLVLSRSASNNNNINNSNSSRKITTRSKSVQSEKEAKENKEAMARAAAALRTAASHVLRHNNNNNNNTNTKTFSISNDKKREASMPLVGCEATAKTRALQLPRTIPQPTGTTRRSRDEEDEEEEATYMNNSRSTSRHGQQHQQGGSKSEDTTLFLRRRSKPRSDNNNSAMSPIDNTERPQVWQESAAMSVPSLCPGMFQGLSAIELNEGLFDGLPGLSREHTSRPPTAQHTSTTSFHSSQLSSHYYNKSNYSRCNESDVGDTSRTTATMRPGAAVVRTRCCARPLWSLIGTFRAALSSVVDVDAQHDSMRWNQRNPHGGYQLIRLSLHSITDVTLVRLVQEDAKVQECQYTLLLRSSARPSQVVFGFRTQKEANQLRSFIQMHANLK